MALLRVGGGLPPERQLSDDAEMPKPTEHHEMILEGVGEWTGKIIINEPGQPQMAIDATETVTALGGFWTTTEFKCDYMGMPFEGRALTGYDVDAKKMVGTWCDTMSSYLAVMEGEIDLENKTIEMTWEAPVMGFEGLVPHRSVMKCGEDEYTSMFFRGEGDAEIQNMTIEMKRNSK